MLLPLSLGAARSWLYFFLFGFLCRTCFCQRFDALGFQLFRWSFGAVAFSGLFFAAMSLSFLLICIDLLGNSDFLWCCGFPGSFTPRDTLDILH